jgi:hypothetical protein
MNLAGIFEEAEDIQSHIGERAAADARIAESATTLAVTDEVAEGNMLVISLRRIVTRTILSSYTRIKAGHMIGCGPSTLGPDAWDPVEFWASRDVFREITVVFLLLAST